MALRAKPRPIPIVVTGQLPGLKLEFMQQEKGNWCWAACTQMLLAFITGRKVAQCGLAHLALQRKCCDQAVESTCDHALLDPQITGLCKTIGVPVASFEPAKVGLAKLKEKIAAGKPVLVGYEYPGKVGHVALVCGIDESGPEPILIVFDPKYTSPLPFSLSSVESAYKLGRWNATWTF